MSLGVVGCRCMLLDVVGCHWTSLDVVGHHWGRWMLLDVVGCHWMSLGVVGCRWMLLVLLGLILRLTESRSVRLLFHYFFSSSSSCPFSSHCNLVELAEDRRRGVRQPENHQGTNCPQEHPLLPWTLRDHLGRSPADVVVASRRWNPCSGGGTGGHLPSPSFSLILLISPVSGHTLSWREFFAIIWHFSTQ